MANLRSLGLHRPTGLQYLVSEGFISEDASDGYHWKQSISLDGAGNQIVEEVLRVAQCVVWSRSGSVKRVFNLDIEAEEVLHAFATTFHDASVTESRASKLPKDLRATDEPSLVVVLKTQLHIFSLSGAIHVVPLSFEVSRALPFAYGCLLQPRGSTARRHVATTTEQYASNGASVTSFLLDDQAQGTDSGPIHSLMQPTYCITDLLCEIGIAGASYMRSPRDAADYSPLPASEEVLYASSVGDMPGKGLRGICVVATLNRSTLTITIWHLVPAENQPGPTRDSNNEKSYRKRQSSNVHERHRVPSALVTVEPGRNSFGGIMQSFVDSEPRPQATSLSNIENLAAELGKDFEGVGIQTRSARRISSMLARTDLAPANDGPTFNEKLENSRKSLSRTMRAEGSLGSFVEKKSFGARRSFPVATSIYSNTTSFLDAGGRLSTTEPNNIGVEDVGLKTEGARLEQRVRLTKLKSFSCHETTASRSCDEITVLLIPHPQSVGQGNDHPHLFSICVHEKVSQLMTVATINAKVPSAEERTRSINPVQLKAVQIQKGTNIADACLVTDAWIRRLLVLSKTSQGDDVLHLEAPWTSSFRLELPNQYYFHETGTQFSGAEAQDRQNVGLHRVISGDEVKIQRFLTVSALSQVAFIDTSKRKHDLNIIMRPQRTLDRRIIDICRFVLPIQLQDSLLVAFWEISRWLETQDNITDPSTAISMTLFTMAVPFINALQSKPVTPGRKKKARVSSGAFVDNTALSSMLTSEKFRSTPPWTHASAWTWLLPHNHKATTSEGLRRSSSAPLSIGDGMMRDHWLLRYSDLTREFLQSPAGEAMSGPEGYLPTAINQDRSVRRTALASIVVGLYLLLEENRLEPVKNASIANEMVVLRALILQITSWLQWQNWKQFMRTELDMEAEDFKNLMVDQSIIDNLDVPAEPFHPQTIMNHIQTSITRLPSTFHSLIDLVRSSEESAKDDPLKAEAARILPRTALVLSILDSALPSLTHQLEFADQLKNVQISAVVSKSITSVNSTQRHTNSDPLKSLLYPTHISSSHIASRDVRTICSQALDAENLGRWDVSSEAERQSVTKMIFGQDRRFHEATRLVNQSRPPEIEYDSQPGWTEANALEAQKLLAQYATRRTFAVVSGRGLMHYNSRMPLLTEMVPRAQFSMQCVLRSRTDVEGSQSMTFSADRTLFTEDKVSWAFFHNGASAGLMISKSASFIDTSWILYNKPPELTNRHAGFLLALGLNGHLKSLAKWVAFKYLTPKHTMTSVGLLLGLAASYKGTTDTLITRLLSVHVTCLLPPGAAELNLSPLTQTTGLIGIGLLYHDSQHRRMSEVMVSEIERQEPEDKSGDEPILRDEGYRLAAGISLGLINLGRGLKLHGLHDMRVVERLLTVAVGTKNVNLVHVLDRATSGAVLAIAFIYMKTNDISVAQKVDIPDTLHQFDYVRPDIFLLRSLARHLIMWDSISPQQSFIQKSLPPNFRHRGDLKAVKQLNTNDLPYFHVIAGVCFAMALKYAGSQCHDARDLLLSYLDQFGRLSRISAVSYDSKVTLNGIRNCLDILALSCATVMAGSGDLDVYRRLRALHGRIDKDTPFGSHLAAHMAIGALFLSGGTATFGTSNLAIASLVVAFYPLFPSDVLDNRGHLQALRHLWVLAVEHRCLTLRDAGDGHLLDHIEAKIALVDGTSKQMLAPGLLPELDLVKSIIIEHEHYWPVKIDLDTEGGQNSNSASKHRSLRDIYKASSNGITVDLQKRAMYDKPHVDQFQAELQELESARNIPIPTATQSSGGVGVSTTSTGHLPAEWLFKLQAFKDLDHAEQALTLTSPQHGSISKTTQSSLLSTTSIDDRLELDIGTLGPETISNTLKQPQNYDKLWQMKLLLTYVDRLEQKESGDKVRNANNEVDDSRLDQQVIWLKDEVIEKLRWRAWEMGRSEGE